MTAPVFVVEHFEAGSGGRYVLDGPEGRHAVSVKRLNPGEDVVLTDGAGRWAECVVVATEGKDRLIVQMDSYSEEPRRSPASPSSRRSPRATGARWPWRR